MNLADVISNEPKFQAFNRYCFSKPQVLGMLNSDNVKVENGWLEIAVSADK